MSHSHGSPHGNRNRCRSQDIADTSRKRRRARAERRVAKNGGKNANGDDRFAGKGFR